MVYLSSVSPSPPTSSGKTEVCVVAHSHVDHGWTSSLEVLHPSRNLNLTFQGYKPEVEKILRSLFCYSASTGRKFIWGEVYFFQRWYIGMTEETLCPGISVYGCSLPSRFISQNKTRSARTDSQ